MLENNIFYSHVPTEITLLFPSLLNPWEGRYMGLHSQRILAQAGFSGVFFAAKILRGELPRYRLPLAEFAANVIPCSAPLTPCRGTSCVGHCNLPLQHESSDRWWKQWLCGYRYATRPLGHKPSPESAKNHIRIWLGLVVPDPSV